MNATILPGVTAADLALAAKQLRSLSNEPTRDKPAVQVVGRTIELSWREFEKQNDLGYKTERYIGNANKPLIQVDRRIEQWEVAEILRAAMEDMPA